MISIDLHFCLRFVLLVLLVLVFLGGHAVIIRIMGCHTTEYQAMFALLG